MNEDEASILLKDQYLYQFLEAIDHFFNFQNHNSKKESKRKLYNITILQTVLTYQPFGSFGELALLNNMRRLAKLEVSDEGDAHFAVLSKEDYRAT